MSGTIDLIQATVRLEQPLGNGKSTIGTGFIVASRAPDGTPRTVLITANHVFARMPGDDAMVGFRALDSDGDWRFAPKRVRIRGPAGAPLWTRHPVQDVAAIRLPEGLTQAAIPASELAGDKDLLTLRVEPGDELLVLGYPRGLSANASGFPILRSGRVASYPLSPAKRFPTFLLDFSVFAGNSGGPVYLVRQVSPASAPIASDGGDRPPALVVVGLLTEQIKLDGDRLAIGNVTQADYILETLSLLDQDRPAEVTPAQDTAPRGDVVPAANRPSGFAGAQQALKDAWSAAAIGARRIWIVVRENISAWTTPDARYRPPRP